uniref:Uncharacterized protein n=1 Tax=viral metagenome TaxID=1070528 RepID=A0A6M3L8S6_9ZZZZ
MVNYYISNNINDIINNTINTGKHMDNMIIKKFVNIIRYNLFNRYHVFKSKSLKPGYHDFDIRMLYLLFDMLVDFVEIELAWMNVCFTNKRPKWPRRWFFRSRKDGIDYLKWEIKQTSGMQLIRANMVKLLYLWWTVYRPQRIDPWDNVKHIDGLLTMDKDSIEYKEFMKQANEADKIDNMYYNEDTEMMKALIEIREDLWT